MKGENMKNQARMCVRVILMAVGVLCVANMQAGLDTECDSHSFSWIWDSDASPANGAIGEQQLSFTISDVSEGVYFLFMNTGDQACSLTDIYFESSLGTLESLISVDDSYEGVSFSQGANPSNMPRWEKVDFEPILGMTTDSDSPAVSLNGVDPGEWLGITIGTQANLDQVCQELNNQSIRIGIHVQAFENGGSESFITPEPATMVLLGLGGLLFRKRK